MAVAQCASFLTLQTATLFERGAAANPARRLRAFPNWGCPDGQSRRLGRQSNSSFCRDAEIDANLGGPSPIGRSREHLWVARARGNAPYDPPLAYDEEPFARAEASRGARDVLVLLRGQNYPHTPLSRTSCLFALCRRGAGMGVLERGPSSGPVQVKTIR
jgi:hypothetical protein